MKHPFNSILKMLRLSSLLFLSVLSLQPILAQTPGAIDLTFNTNDIGFGNGDGFDNELDPVSDIVIQSDGKVIVTGNFSKYNGVGAPGSGLIRLNPDGSIDQSFAVGTGLFGGGGPLAIQPDGKIIVAGIFDKYNGTNIKNIARINIDGTLDNSFNPGTSTNGKIYAMLLQVDGKILIGGQFTTYNGVSRIGIARLNSDGTLDASFDPGTGVDPGTGFVHRIYSMALQQDGKVIIGGGFFKYNGIDRSHIARINSDGSLDTSFNPGTGTGPISSVNDIAIQTDGKIFIAGEFSSYNGSSKKGLARINGDGTIDQSFNSFQKLGPIWAVKILSDGKIVIGGQFQSFNGFGNNTVNRIAKLNADGSLDTGFNFISGFESDNSFGFNNAVRALAIQSDGKIIAGGDFRSYYGIYRGGIARLNPDASLDHSFNKVTGCSMGLYGSVRTLAVQSDGKTIVGGEFNTINDIKRKGISRLNIDGTVDETFDPGDRTSSVTKVVIQTDGKILIAGGYSYNGVLKGIARLNADGTQDTSFDPIPFLGLNGASFLALQPDGKVLIRHVNQSTVAVSYLRLNSNGSHDVSFNTGIGPDDDIYDVKVQPDGKILMGGWFTQFNGNSVSGIIRLNVDGSIDNTFNSGTGLDGGRVESIWLQPDGKIIIGGWFGEYNGVPRLAIARLNSNGTLDTTFDPGTGANGPITDVLGLPDGKLVVAGEFLSINGASKRFIARLNANGSVDTNFDPGTSGSVPDGSNASGIRAIALQSDGRIIVGGIFTSYNGTGRNRIARILDSKLTQTISFDPLAPVNVGASPITLSAASSSGLPVSYSSSNTDVASISGNTLTILGGGTTKITAKQSGNSTYYAANDVEQTFIVNKLNQTITFSALPTKNFGDPTFSLSAAANSGLTISYSSSNTSVATVSGNIVTIVGAGTSTITASQPGDNNYNAATSVDQTLTVNKANQSITFNSLPTKSFGDPTFSLSAAANSGLTISYSSSNTSVATVSGNILTIVGAGTSIITASQPGNNNYNPANSVDQTLTVNKANQSITFNSLPTKSFGDPTFSLSGTATSGLTISYSSSNTSVATVSGNIVTIVSAGTSTITANQSGNSNYNAAISVDQTLTVNKANQTITFNSLPQKSLGDIPFNISATASSDLAVSFQSSNTSVATISSNTVTIVGSGTATITASQAGNSNYNAATPIDQLLLVKANQSITFDPIPTKTLGNVPFNLNAVATSSLPVQYSTTSNKISITNSQVTLLLAGRVNITAGQPGDANYNPASEVSQSFCINPAKPTITLSNDNTESPTLTSSSNAGNQWFLNGSLISNAVNSTLSVTEPGIYTITVTVDDCVSEQSTGFPIVITDITENPQISSLHIFPNPTNRYINVDLTSYKAEPVELTIYQEQGISLSSTNVIGGKTEQLEIQNYGQGMYFLVAKQGKVSQISKFIKH